MTRPLALAGLALLAVALVVHTPGALACSWTTPEVERVTWTQQGLFFLKRDILVRGDERTHETIAELSAFDTYLVGPAGALAYMSRGEGGVGADCRVPYRAVDRWTVEEGVVNVTDRVPTLPLAVHWLTARGVLNDGPNTTIVDLTTGETLATLRPGQPSRNISFIGDVGYVRGAAWSPTGDAIVLLTERDAWLFRPDGSYVHENFPSYPVQGSHVLAAFSPDGGALAVAQSYGDRASEIRVLDLEAELEHLYSAGHVDLGSAQAMAYGPQGVLALALQESPLFHGDDERPRARIALFDEDLRPLGNVSWPGQWVDTSLSWSPAGDALVVVLDDRIVRVPVADILAGERPGNDPPPVHGDDPPGPPGTGGTPRAIGSVPVALLLAGCLLLALRRRLR